MLNAIQYVTGGATLVAFVVAAVYLLRSRQLRSHDKAISSAPPAARAQLAAALAETLVIPITDVPAKERAGIVHAEIRRREAALRMKLRAALAMFAMLIVAMALLLWFDRPDVPPEPNVSLSIEPSAAQVRVAAEFLGQDGLLIPEDQRLASDTAFALTAIVDNYTVPSQSVFVNDMSLEVEGYGSEPLSCEPFIFSGIGRADHNGSWWNQQDVFAGYSISAGTRTDRQIGFRCADLSYSAFLARLREGDEPTISLNLSAFLRGGPPVVASCIVDANGLRTDLAQQEAVDQSPPKYLQFSCGEGT